MHKNIKIFFSIVSLTGIMLLAGCGNVKNPLQGSDLTLLTTDESYEKAEKAEYGLIEDKKSLYENEHDVKVIYLTVGKGSESDGTNYTFAELNALELGKLEDEKPYKCEAVVQFGNEDGPVLGEFGYGVTTANATVSLNGEKASTKPQKNYKIDIKSGEGSVDGIKSFILSKNFTDPFRITDKVCYELMEDIPDMLSTRTYFAHLYIKDVTESKDTKFVDYGLYTMVEPVNKRYLNKRGLDKTGELYKAVDFDWKRHTDVIMQPTDSGYDKDKFEKLLISKGGNDYSKLIEVLDAVNDESLPISDIVKTYFYEDNIYSWMAFNILVNNKDTDTENYYIYCPTGTNKFYFISWDNDGAFRDDYELLKDSNYDAGWQTGAFIYQDSVLFRRILQDEACVNKLTEAIYNLHNGALSADKIVDKFKTLSSLSKEYIYDLTDRSFARVTEANYDLLIAQLAEQVDRNFYAYYDSVEGPWPFSMIEPTIDDGGVTARWEASSAIGNDVKYNLLIDDSWDFASPITDEKGLTDTSYEIGNLKPGQYFMRVTAFSDEAHELGAKNYYNTEKKNKVYNVLCFYVFEDGSIGESSFD